MEKIYVIIQANAYDAFYLPYNEQFYLTEEEAQKECDELNIVHCGANKKYWDFDVHELTLKK